MSSLSNTDDLKEANVLLMGDFMLDVYTFGRAQRLSPEAPVPLLFVEKESARPGGGGNAILNLLSLGMKVTAVGRIGQDPAGKQFSELINEPNVDTGGIFVEKEFQTPLKKRMIADTQQLLRVDYEKATPLSPVTETAVKEYVSSVISKVSIVAISDYGKGFFTPTLLEHTVREAKKHQIPVIVDPKGIDFRKYKGATLIKPNMAEAIQASGLSYDASLKNIAGRILEATEIDVLMITRAKEGISLFWKEGEEAHFPAVVKEVRDVTGAGDTVFAVITGFMANRADLKKGAKYANVAASIAVGQVGCARVSKKEIMDLYEEL